MIRTEILAEKIVEIKNEMKLTGLWKRNLPVWVNEYRNENIKTEQDFAEWLQFVYLPNMMQLENRSSMGTEKYIVPQAVQFFGADMQKGKLLQLLIELDGLL
jgi:uncharacterized protein YqcC (DUF446 family)